MAQIDLTYQVKGVLPIVNGGTGNISGGGGGGGSLPDQTGQSGKVLVTDGTNPLWFALMFPGNLDGGMFDPPVTFGTAFNFDGGIY